MEKICTQFFSNLKLRDGKFWVTSGQEPSQELSYPEEGHSFCYQIEDSSFWFQHRNRVISKVYAKFLNFKKPKVFIDLGGGNGFMTKAFQDAGVESILIEPMAGGAANATARGVKNVICATWESLSLQMTNFDVGLFDVIEHLENPQNLLTDLNERMGAESKIFITVPAYQFLWSAEDVMAGHFRRYSRSQLKTELERAGFEVIYMTGFFTFLILPIFLLRKLPYFFKKNFTVKEEKLREAHSQTSSFLKLCMAIEEKWMSFFNIPFGASFLVVAQKSVRAESRL